MSVVGGQLAGQDAVVLDFRELAGDTASDDVVVDAIR